MEKLFLAQAGNSGPGCQIEPSSYRMQLLLDLERVMKQHFRFDYTFPRNYEVRVLEVAPPVHPVEKLYHFPVELEEGDRSGAYLRVIPQNGLAWAGFFVQGFDSGQVISEVCSAPDPDSFCAEVGGYAYLVDAGAHGRWQRAEPSR